MTRAGARQCEEVRRETTIPSIVYILSSCLSCPESTADRMDRMRCASLLSLLFRLTPYAVSFLLMRFLSACLVDRVQLRHGLSFIAQRGVERPDVSHLELGLAER